MNLSGLISRKAALEIPVEAGWDRTPAVSRERGRGEREMSDDTQQDSGSSGGEELAMLQAASFSARLKKSDSSDSLKSTATSKLKPKDLDCQKGRNNEHFDGSRQGRAVYCGTKSLQGTVTWMAGALQPGAVGTTPLQSLAASPMNDLGTSIAPSTVSGFAADSAVGAILWPLSLMSAWTSFQDFRSARKRNHELKDPHAKEVNKLSMYENFFSFVSAGAFHIKTAIALGAKPFVLLAETKGAGMFAAMSGSGAIQGLGIAANFVLGPIAAVALMAEAAFSLRRYIRSKQEFKRTAPEARAFMEQMAKARPAGMSEEEFAQFQVYKKEFFDRKYELRSSFWSRAKKMTWFRLGATAFFGATVATKFAVGIAALGAGGFLVSNPVGWALLGVTIVAAVLVTVGAFAYLYSRRRSRYEQYRRNDDPMIDKAFHQAVEKFMAERAPKDERVTATTPTDRSEKAPARVPTARALARDAVTPRSANPVSPRQALSRSSSDDSHEPLFDHEDYEDSSAPAATAAAAPQRNRNKEASPERQPLLLDPREVAQIDTDSDDDNDDNLVQPGHFALGAHARATNFNMVGSHQAAHGALTQKLGRSLGKSQKPNFGARIANIGTKLSAWCNGSFKLLRSGSWTQARVASRKHWATHARNLTSANFRQVISNHAPEWRDFMQSHLRAEHAHLTNKIATRAQIQEMAGAEENLSDSPIMRNAEADAERLASVDSLIERIQNPDNERVFEFESIPDPDTNRAFLKLLGNREAPRELTDEEVDQSLARAMKTQYARRIADLKGTLFEAELDCSAARLAEQSTRTPEPATARG